MVEVTESAAEVLRKRLEDTSNQGKPIRIVFQGYG